MKHTRMIAILLVLCLAVGLSAQASDTLRGSVATVNGAQMRTTGAMGLRFISTIGKDGDFERVVEFGTILVPSETEAEIEIGVRWGVIR